MKCKTDAYRIVTLESEGEQAGPSGERAAVRQDAGTEHEPSEEPVGPGVDTHDAAMVRPPTGQRTAGSSTTATWTAEAFHERIRFREHAHIDEVHQFYAQNYHVLTDECGVLLLLYTVLQTKGLEHILSEMSDPTESLIHDTYGCGSQALINLMLTGRAVPHVWDNEQDVGGMSKWRINFNSNALARRIRRVAGAAAAKFCFILLKQNMLFMRSKWD